MISKRTNKLSIPKTIVAGTTTALVSNTPIVNSTNALAIANGQLAVMSFDHSGTIALGTALTTGGTITATNVAAVKVVQGTPGSANVTTVDNVFKTGDPALVESGVIERSKIISFAAKKAKIATNGAVLVTPGAAAIVANTQYGLYTELISQNGDRDNSDNDNVLTSVIETPDWGGVAGAAPAQPKDWVLQNIAAQINSRSRAVRSAYGTGAEDIICFGVKTTGGAASGNGNGALTIGATSIGDIINVQVTNSITTTFTADAAFVQMLAQMRAANATAFAATATWEIVDLTTAGTTAKFDSLLIVGLPRVKSKYFDDIEQVYPTVKVNAGFAWQPTMVASSLGVTIARVAADEGTGQGWKLDNADARRNRLFNHTMQTQPHGEWFNTGVDYINPDLLYHQYTLEYFDTESTINNEVMTPKQLTILLPATMTAAADANAVTALANGGYFATAATAEPTTTLDSTLGYWLRTCASSGFSSIQLKGTANTTNYFTV